MSTNSSTTEALTAGRLPPPAITSEGKRESSREEKGLGKTETSGESKSLRAEGREEGGQGFVRALSQMEREERSHRQLGRNMSLGTKSQEKMSHYTF